MLHIVWFKRDLRIADHKPLTEALKTGEPVLLLYVFEPELWQQPDLSFRHHAFLVECLKSLNHHLKAQLTVKVGSVIDILTDIQQKNPNITLWSHQETWNNWTYQRDKAVLQWTQKHIITWHEYVNFGVFRRLKNRDDWALLWHQEMYAPIIETAPLKNITQLPSDKMSDSSLFNLTHDGCQDLQRQKGGRAACLETFNSFLYKRGEGYTQEMSSPVTAWQACSRISPYLAFGVLSMREAFQTALIRYDDLNALPYNITGHITGKWKSALKSFLSRLRWHCHFIQKLEDEPEIEYSNMHILYNGLRENDFNTHYFNAFKAGKTGYPLIDACMRALIATGWINFRMRAMLMSFSAYHLWLHWQRPAHFLAQLFVDYEPGIHYSQAQMQSGTTGINAIRIYNPIKQSQDQDPEGIFIKQWIPELVDMPTEFIHTPWEKPEYMHTYPMPIIDEKTARKAASDKIYALKKTLEHKAEAKNVFQKHGSRKTQSSQARKSKKKSLPKKTIKKPISNSHPNQGTLLL
ncbi:MAG: deoxyribodipyrimidine photo-lyase [Alphaproteobacteria bacterium]|jgi:deoxyribodipyrimidine photo-lyase